MEVKKISIDEVNFDPSNVRKHDKKNLSAIISSLKRFGQQKPIVIDSNNIVRAGNGTLEAAKQLGWKEINVVQSDLDKSELTAYAIADNRTAELAEWDMDGLTEQLKSLDDELRDIAYEDFEFPDDPLEPNEKDDEIPETNENEFGVKLGDIWILGNHRLMCGDSTDKAQVYKLMDGQKAEMVFTDPPYGIGEAAKDHKTRGKIAKPTIYKKGDWDNKIPDKKIFELILSLNIPTVIWGGNYFTEFLPPSGSWVVWNKNMTGDFSDCELAWSNYKNAVRYYEQTWNGMIRQGETGKRVHPTQKPIALAEWCFEKYCSPKSVLDLFLGSGSTLIACEKTNRTCYGMEIDPHYCSVIIKRWEEFSGKKAHKV